MLFRSLIRRKPEMTPRLLESIGQQPDKIIAQMRAFSTEFEQTFGITRD